MLRTALAIVALLLSLGLAAGSPRPDTLETQLRAVGSGSVWKYTESGVTRYYTDTGDVRYGQWYSVYPPAQGNEHGMSAFDLSPIPDTALLLSANLLHGLSLSESKALVLSAKGAILSAGL